MVNNICFKKSKIYLALIVYYQYKIKWLILALLIENSFHHRLDSGTGEDDLFLV